MNKEKETYVLRTRGHSPFWLRNWHAFWKKVKWKRSPFYITQDKNINIQLDQSLNLWYQKLGNLLDSDCKTNAVIELEMLFGVAEPLEKGDDSSLLFEDVLLKFVLVWSIMEINGLTKRINKDYK